MQQKKMMNNIFPINPYWFSYICNMNAFFSFDLFMVYIPECKAAVAYILVYKPWSAYILVDKP
jgi:hypothetical protein